MRLVWIGFVASIAIAGTAAFSQTADLFQTVRPQVLLSVHRDPNGSRADLIEVRTIDPKYPPEQLRTQILELGRQMGSEPRGLLIARATISSGMSTIKATFAVDNLIDRNSSKLHLQEIARSFAGYEGEHAVTGISVQFVGEPPKSATLLAYGEASDPVQVQGVYDPTFHGVEYRIKLNTQDPKLIEIPEGAEQKPAASPSTDARKGTDWTLWALIGVAAIAVGALVYSLLVNSKVSKGLKR